MIRAYKLDLKANQINIDRFSNRNKIKPSLSKRYRRLIKKIRDYLKNEINRIINHSFLHIFSKSHKLGWTLVLALSVRKSNPLYGVGTSVPQLRDLDIQLNICVESYDYKQNSKT